MENVKPISNCVRKIVSFYIFYIDLEKNLKCSGMNADELENKPKAQRVLFEVFFYRSSKVDILVKDTNFSIQFFSRSLAK